MEEDDYSRIKNEVEGIESIPTLPQQLPIQPTKEPPKISEIAKEPYFKPEKKQKTYFWKIYAIILTLVLMGGLGYLYYDGDFNPQFNSTSQIDNQYDIKVNPSINSPFTANLDNNFTNNFEFTFDLSEEFIAEVCGE